MNISVSKLATSASTTTNTTSNDSDRSKNSFNTGSVLVDHLRLEEATEQNVVVINNGGSVSPSAVHVCPVILESDAAVEYHQMQTPLQQQQQQQHLQHLVSSSMIRPSSSGQLVSDSTISSTQMQHHQQHQLGSQHTQHSSPTSMMQQQLHPPSSAQDQPGVIVQSSHLLTLSGLKGL